MKINRQLKGEIARKLSRIVMSFSFLLLVAGSALAQKVSVDFDKSADFSQYKTNAWGKGTPAANPMIHQRIVAGIEAQLAGKGLRKAESNPDIVVIYHAATDTQVSINTLGGGPLAAGGGGREPRPWTKSRWGNSTWTSAMRAPGNSSGAEPPAEPSAASRKKHTVIPDALRRARQSPKEPARRLGAPGHAERPHPGPHRAKEEGRFRGIDQ